MPVSASFKPVHIRRIGDSKALVLGVLALILMQASGCTPTPIAGDRGVAAEEQGTLMRYRFARVMMGSRCEITIEGVDEPAAARAAGLAFDEIKRIERALSDYDPNSEIMRIMQMQPGLPHLISPTLLEALLISGDIHNASGGAYDPTVGSITHLWRQAAQDKTIPSRSDLHNALARVGFEHLTIDPHNSTLRFELAGMTLDFGGIGKGYAARAGVELLRDLGYPVVCVDMGGDLQLGDPPNDSPRGWRVEVVTGIGKAETFYLHNIAIATSGDLERFFEHNGKRYSHIIDPRTGLGLTDRRAATVIAPDGAIADALASAISVLGETGKAQLECAYPHASISVVSRSLDDE